MIGPARFRFLSVERELMTSRDWDRVDWPRLWRYNLHYFDDLVALEADERISWHRALVERWMAENPPGAGTGWEPYPASLRLVNWIKWSLADAAASEGAPPRLSSRAVHSLAVQVRWLRQRLEIHLLGNHLWANAKALVFAGAFFDGPEAHRWLCKGLALLRRELGEQILPDGGHFERSPMYHAALLEDLIDLLQLGDRYPGSIPDADRGAWRDAAVRMLRWLRIMTHPDGGIAFFNDAAHGVAPPLSALEDYAARACHPVFAGACQYDDSSPSIVVLSDSGYVRLQAGPATLIADVGRIGPDYLPGHAHADTLSFELSLHGHRAIVNTGTSTYETGVERMRQRGTASHSTVIVDETDSSEIWGSFRVARRARPLDVQWGTGPDGASWLRAAHDGYLRLPGRVVHRREWRLTERSLHVVDRLDGAARNAQARFHLHPAIEPVDVGVDLTKMRIEPSTWHPLFGVAIGNQVLVADFGGQNVVETAFRWR